jgi:threonine dehydratase
VTIARESSSPGPTRPDAPADLVTLDEIRAAARRIAGVALRTPLLPFGPAIAGDPLGRTRAWLKPESLQPIGAFKIRGALNALASLTAAERARGVVTHSSGNHAQGVARAARLLGIRAVVVMPDDAPAVKVAGVRADGARIDVVGPSSEERAQRAHDLAERDGLVLIPSYDDRRIVAGQGTAGLEIAEQLADLAELTAAAPAPAEGPWSAGKAAQPTVLVPIGGGGLISGVAAAVKALLPRSRVIGVEPELAADAQASLRAGRIVRWEADVVGRTCADGMRTTALGAVTFPHVQALVDDIVTVSEVDIARAMVRAARAARLVVEPSGATTLAAWLFHADALPPTGPVVVLLSGGNVDPARYADLIAAGEAAGG